MKDTRNDLHPFGPVWEERADQLLSEAQFDPELGEHVARDAQRVVAGELSEHEFYEKYHAAYLREFGADHRPLATGREALETSKEPPVDGRGAAEKPAVEPALSRRNFLMRTGQGAAALAVGASLAGLIPGFRNPVAEADTGVLQAEKGSEPSARTGPVQMGMVIDLERCTGCLACMDACHRENNTSEGVHWIYVFAYEDENQEDLNFLVRPCQHCSNPPCVKVCPTMARHKREKDGLVLTDYDACIGCRYCCVACPYGVNFFQWGEPNPEEGYRYPSRLDYRGRKVSGNAPRGVVDKCTFCPQRQDSEWKTGTASCQLACPHDVIHFGDINDPNSAPRRYLEQRRQEKGGSISTFRLLEELGTEPNIIYIGHRPSTKARQADGPIKFEDWGWTDERRAVLEGPRPWFARNFGSE